MARADTSNGSETRTGDVTWEGARLALHEYRVLKELLHHVIDFISSPQCNLASIRALLSDLRSLREHLECHFELEEESGLFDDILADTPMIDAALRELREEHPRFLEEVESLVVRLEQTDVKAVDLIRYDLYRFVHAFLRHEERESDLLQSAYFLDIGVCD